MHTNLVLNSAPQLPHYNVQNIEAVQGNNISRMIKKTRGSFVTDFRVCEY
jgi:hypothetical protein